VPRIAARPAQPLRGVLLLSQFLVLMVAITFGSLWYASPADLTLAHSREVIATATFENTRTRDRIRLSAGDERFSIHRRYAGTICDGLAPQSTVTVRAWVLAGALRGTEWIAQAFIDDKQVVDLRDQQASYRRFRQVVNWAAALSAAAFALVVVFAWQPPVRLAKRN
jgi:hypothetical protein